MTKQLNYAYVWDETDQYYVPRIAADGPFKGVRVDHLPVAETLQKAYVILQSLSFVTVVEMRPTRVLFSLEPCEEVGHGTVTEQRLNVLKMLNHEFKSLRF